MANIFMLVAPQQHIFLVQKDVEISLEKEIFLVIATVNLFRGEIRIAEM
jgi:hypothetical protein